MVKAWNTGEAIAELPPANPEVVYPPEPEESADLAVRIRWRRRVREIENEIAGFHSNRCYLNLQLELARAFIDQTFYFPHNIDFRGRAYPIPAILNHMGADNARGLLRFAKGRELGAAGLTWLKVHLANTYGFDKASLKEREQFTMDHLEDMRDSALNSLNGKRWWLTAEDPWQCLAACFELTAALDCPDPAKFVSHLPVHQDGTCNGLQHYAALGGDMMGATQVNLVPGDRPADIYSEVARLVRTEIEKDEEQGNAMAKLLHGKISRKVVKQTVMTNVYGVTFIGARAQVQKQLDVIIPKTDETVIDNYSLSAYIAKTIFKVLGDMFKGASGIQHWLAACAARIATALTPEQIEKLNSQLHDKPTGKKKNKSKSKKGTAADFQSSVIWTTPLNLPVVQPYRNTQIRAIPTQMQSVWITEPRSTDPVLKRKQMQAFPPNFVHSLDATHMLLSALKCDEIGLTFAAVHDSFWTHAADVPVMNRILRDAFVRMHSENIIGRLAEEFNARYRGSIQQAVVYSRSPLGQRVKALRAQRRKVKSESRTAKAAIKDGGRRKVLALEELIEEYERLRLLRSDDPSERERGEAMVTPGSLYAAVKPGSVDFVQEEVSEVATLGSMSEHGGLEPEHDNDAELADEATPFNADSAAQESDDVSSSGAPVKGPRKRLPAKRNPTCKVWVPLTFPTVPQRGDFDVSMLKDSAYFFS
jgi:DNA-directed RNA polymerase